MHVVQLHTLLVILFYINRRTHNAKKISVKAYSVAFFWKVLEA